MKKFLSGIGTAAVFACSLLLNACGQGEAGNNTPDVSKVAISYTAHPFYKDLAAIDTGNISEGLRQMKAKYPAFLDFYLDTMMGFDIRGGYDEPNRMLHDFLTMKDYRNLLDTVVLAFPDTRRYDDWLQQSFRYIRHYDKSFTLPEHVYYFVSGLRGITAALQSDDNIGVGLDMFLGEDFFPYRQLNKSNFEIIRMTSENIPVWVCRALYEDRYPFIPEDKNLLALMVEKGKELYFLEKVTPYLKDETRLGFTPEQLSWCQANEALVYNLFIQNNLLFENNLQKTMRYVSDGPAVPGLPGDSPGNIGSYMGWRIVKQYAARNNVDMHTLLETKDARKILEGAAYKP